MSLVGGAFEFGESRTVEAKGKDGGVECRELGRMFAPRRPRGGHGLETRFVGRRRELDWLEDVFARTQADGRPRLAAVVGEAGIGKTSLVREFGERLPHGTAFRLGRCLAYGRSVTYSALADVLRQELGLRQEDSPEEVLERLAGREILGLTVGQQYVTERGAGRNRATHTPPRIAVRSRMPRAMPSSSSSRIPRKRCSRRLRFSGRWPGTPGRPTRR